MKLDNSSPKNNSFIFIIGLSLLVGIITSFGCISFHLLIEFFSQVFFGEHDKTNFISVLSQLSALERVLTPALGGLLVGTIFTYVKLSEAEGEGVPEVLKAIRFKSSKIRLLVAPVKIITAAITLGSGGSAGREGPIVQIGSAIGSSVGQKFKQSEQTTNLLLAAGAAAGIGGTFGAPLAGILFSLELILKTVSLRTVSIISLAAFTSNQITTRFLGFEGFALKLPSDFSISAEVLILSLLIGAGAGIVAVFFGKSLRAAEDIFTSLRLPLIVNTTLGGLLIGIIALFFPYIHEPATYPLMLDLLLISSLPLVFLAALLFMKIIATAITLGSGGSGGVLAPALLTGLIFGNIIALLIPVNNFISTSDTAALGLIGMAGVFAGITHAPFMSVILLYEVTSEPLVLPLVAFSTGIAYLTAKNLRADSVYTNTLKKSSLI